MLKKKVNNAGMGTLVDMFHDLKGEEIEQTFRTNVNGPLYMINAVIPHMPSGGRIINVSSAMAVRGSEVTIGYAASKAALDNITWSLAGVVRVILAIPVSKPRVSC